MNAQRQDLIDRYLLGRMTDAERQATERDLERDPELRADLAFTRRTRAALTSRVEKLRAILGWDKERRQHRRVRLIGRASIISLAAVLVVGAFVLRYRENTPTVAPSANIVADTYRGASASTERISALMQAERYDEALAVTDSLLDDLHRSLPDIEDAQGEEREYQQRVYRQTENDLLTIKAAILIVLDRKDEADEILSRMKIKAPQAPQGGM